MRAMRLARIERLHREFLEAAEQHPDLSCTILRYCPLGWSCTFGNGSCDDPESGSVEPGRVAWPWVEVDDGLHLGALDHDWQGVLPRYRYRPSPVRATNGLVMIENLAWDCSMTLNDFEHRQADSQNDDPAFLMWRTRLSETIALVNSLCSEALRELPSQPDPDLGYRLSFPLSERPCDLWAAELFLRLRPPIQSIPIRGRGRPTSHLPRLAHATLPLGFCTASAVAIEQLFDDNASDRPVNSVFQASPEILNELTSTGTQDRGRAGDENQQTNAVRLSKAQALAYCSFRYAASRLNDTPQDRAAWDWLHDNGMPTEADGPKYQVLVGYKLPAFDTWSRYVRKGRRENDDRKHTPRASRETGPSVIRQRDK